MVLKEKGTVRFLYQGSNYRIGQSSLPGAVRGEFIVIEDDDSLPTPTQQNQSWRPFPGHRLPALFA